MGIVEKQTVRENNILKYFVLPVENFPPVIVSASDVINATLDSIVQFNITAEDEDSVKFEVINTFESATEKRSGNALYFSWNVTSSQKVHNFKQQSAQPAKTSVSSCSSPLGTFRGEERLRLSDRNSTLMT